MEKSNRYTEEFKVKIIKFPEQNGNQAVEREFYLNEAQISYWRKQKGICKAKCSVKEYSVVPKLQHFLSMKKTTSILRRNIEQWQHTISHEMLQS
jgi:hypothetical protein